MSRQIETELKTLLEESLRREKMSTFEEENKGTDKERDKHWNQLLRENARIKVELRMAEFELKKRFQHFQRSQHWLETNLIIIYRKLNKELNENIFRDGFKW